VQGIGPSGVHSKRFPTFSSPKTDSSMLPLKFSPRQPIYRCLIRGLRGRIEVCCVRGKAVHRKMKKSSNMDSVDQGVHVQCGKLPFGGEPDVILLVSIDQYGDKKWKVIGTAFPLLHNGMVVLVTAGHVVEKLSGVPVHALNPREGSQISLSRASVSFNAEMDLAVIFCSSVDLHSLFNCCTCIDVDYTRVSAEDSGGTGIYQVYGYPVSKNKISRTSRFDPHMFRISLGKPNRLPARSRLSDLRVPLMCFDIAPDRLLDDDMKKTFALGKFDGMSGGPVIRHSTSHESLYGTLVGMFVEWHSVEKTAVVIPICLITMWIDVWMS
jgi:hypothetical protein